MFPDELPTVGLLKGTTAAAPHAPLKVLINTDLRHLNNIITFLLLWILAPAWSYLTFCPDATGASTDT